MKLIKVENGSIAKFRILPYFYNFAKIINYIFKRSIPIKRTIFFIFDEINKKIEISWEADIRT